MTEMEKQEVRLETIKVFKEVFRKTTLFSEATTANDIEGWDSLNHMILIGKLEQRFELKFNLFKLIELRSIGDFVNYIYKDLNNENPGN